MSKWFSSNPEVDTVNVSSLRHRQTQTEFSILYQTKTRGTVFPRLSLGNKKTNIDMKVHQQSVSP